MPFVQVNKNMETPPQPPHLDVVVDAGFLFNDDSPIQVEVRMFIDFFNISHHHQDGRPSPHVDGGTRGGILQFRIYIHRNFILFSVSINFKCSSSSFESILWNMVSSFYHSLEKVEGVESPEQKRCSILWPLKIWSFFGILFKSDVRQELLELDEGWRT